MIISNYHNLFFGSFFTFNQAFSVMELSAILLLVLVTLLKAIGYGLIAFWFSLTLCYSFPTLGKYLVRVFDFDK